MKYLKIENAGSLNRKKLELIGLSTKRDKIGDAETIGHKGSGTKLAAIAAKRLGLEVSIASTDHIGTYLMNMVIDERQEGDALVKRLLFDYSPSHCVDGKPVGERVPSGLTIDAFEDWDKPIGTDTAQAFKVLREFICNARDEQKDFSLSIVEKVGVVPAGRTAVYLRCTPEIAEMVTTKAARYFKFRCNDAPIFLLPGLGSVYPKSDPASTRLFLLGVLVDCRNEAGQKSLFDYSLNDKALISEERILKNYWLYLNEVAKLFGRLADEGLIARIMAAAVQKEKAPFELDVMHRIPDFTPESRIAWHNVARKMFGEKLCVSSQDDTVDQDAAQISGYAVLGKGDAHLRAFFSKLGLPDAKLIAPTLAMEIAQVRFEDLESESRARFYQAFRIFARHFPERTGLPIHFFVARNKHALKIAGFCGAGDRMFKEVWIRTAGPKTLSSVQDLFETLVHETRHCVTQAGDYARAFIDKADTDLSIAILRMDHYQKLGNGDPMPPAGDVSKIRPWIASVPVPKTVTPIPLVQGSEPTIIVDSDIEAWFEDAILEGNDDE